MKNEQTSILRIVFESHEQYRVVDSAGTEFKGELAGKLRTQTTVWPAVGDWVEGLPQPGSWILITGVLERRSVLKRRAAHGNGEQILAANVDFLFIVTSANQDFNLNRLDRYVTIALSSGITPVILINKIDLAEDTDGLFSQIKERFPNIDVVGISALEGQNLDTLQCFLTEGKTVTLVGSSGVGKSTLVNRLLHKKIAETHSIRESDSRGRHTTTHRQLHFLPTGTALIDSPGIRQVGLTDDVDLSPSFGEINSLALQCKFTDCKHETEPNCAIHQALETNVLSKEQWESFKKLQKELAYEKRKTSKALQAEERKKWSRIQRDLRAKYKARNR